MKTYLKDLKFEEIIKRLKNGEAIWSEGGQYVIKYYDGISFIAYEDGSYEINPSFITDSSREYFFETEEPFEIKETGLYKTRDGKKAFVSYIDNGIRPVNGIIEGEEEMMYWTRDGFIYDARKYDREDIISKWED